MSQSGDLKSIFNNYDPNDPGFLDWKKKQQEKEDAEIAKWAEQKTNEAWERSQSFKRKSEIIQSDKPANLITAKQIIEKEFPATRWLVKDLVPAVGFTAITGAPATYKSFITEHIAICLALGTPAFGEFEVSQCPVLIIDKENHLSLIKDRLVKLGVKDDPPIYFLETPDDFEINDEAQFNWLNQIVKEKNIQLVIIDSFIHFHRGDEQGSTDTAKTFETLKQINCAWLIIHHHKKRDVRSFNVPLLESTRGSSDFAAELEAHMAVEAMADGKLKISQGKNRWGPLTKPFMITPIIDELSATLIYEGFLEEEINKADRAHLFVDSLLSTGREVSRKEMLDLASDEGLSRTTIDRVIKLKEINKEIKSRKDGVNKFITLLIDTPQGGVYGNSSIQQSYLDEIDD